MNTTTPVRIGASSDRRTNRWRITCPACDKPFEPQTTMLGTQSMTCPNKKCGAEILANYNAEPPTAQVIAPEPEDTVKVFPGTVSGVNDPKPTERPAKGMAWVRMKGGPRDGDWVQKPKAGGALKLTAPQLALLKERRGRCVTRYKPYIALVAAGLIKAGKESGGYAEWATTAAGEQHLRQLEQAAA